MIEYPANQVYNSEILEVTAVWRDLAAVTPNSDEDPRDLLKDRYASPMKTKLKAEVTTTTKELPPIELSVK